MSRSPHCSKTILILFIISSSSVSSSRGSSRPPGGWRAAAATSTGVRARVSAAAHAAAHKLTAAAEQTQFKCTLCVNARGLYSRGAAESQLTKYAWYTSNLDMAGSWCTWWQLLQMVLGPAQHITHAMSGLRPVCWIAIGRASWEATNQRRGLKAGESGSPGRTKAYCSGFWQYLLNNWSIVENNSLYEGLCHDRGG